MKTKKLSMLFLVTLVVIILGVSAVNAADIDDKNEISTQAQITTADMTPDVHQMQQKVENTDKIAETKNIEKKRCKNTKTKHNKNSK
ncbi:MAG: hypothetical protein MRZ80_03055 [Methanosphaera sp.]|uniref:hypothetical protein n=1 Tax=Methanosphaera sp. TaxID=2666342 RepID=UPI0025DB86C3|nr:hypothetical protein [Methanosphaera sp.]MCI5867064.1 hypothetical protein [Methanosphaera sp.]